MHHQFFLLLWRTFSSLSNCPWPKNQSCCWSEKAQHHWMMSQNTQQTGGQKKTLSMFILTCRMSVSTILYRSGMWVTMSVMLSSDVLTRVGPNTRAKFLGSIWKRRQSYVNKQLVSIKLIVICTRLPYSFQSYLPLSSDGRPGTSGCGNSDLGGRGSAKKKEKHNRQIRY